MVLLDVGDHPCIRQDATRGIPGVVVEGAADG